jgi:hypothetical protein
MRIWAFAEDFYQIAKIIRLVWFGLGNTGYTGLFSFGLGKKWKPIFSVPN